MFILHIYFLIHFQMISNFLNIKINKIISTLYWPSATLLSKIWASAVKKHRSTTSFSLTKKSISALQFYNQIAYLIR